MGFRRSLGISAISQLVTFVLGFANVIVVSRLLAPEEIGIFSVAVSVLGFAHILREFGVGHYLVQASEINRLKLRAAFTVAIITSWAIAALLFFAKDLMAGFYKNEGVADVLGLVVINFIALPFGTPVLALLKRDREFGKLAKIAIFGAVVQTVVTIGAAIAGQSYLSMAWGSLAMILSKVVILFFIRPAETFLMPGFRGIREVLQFGSITSFSSLVEESGRVAPDLIFGRTLGFSEVAFFSRSMGVQRMIVERINNLVRTVHFPTFAAEVRAGHDAAALYLRVTNYLVVVTVPVLAVLAILAEPLIVFMFGAQWERSALLSSMLCVAMMFTAPYSLYGLSLIAAGRPSLHLVAELLIQSVRVMVLLTSIWLPLEQVVALLVVAYCFEAVVCQLALMRAFELTWIALMKNLWRAWAVLPFALAGPGAVAFFGWHLGLQGEYRLITLILSAVLALLGWVGGLWVVRHPMRDEVHRAMCFVFSYFGVNNKA